MVNSTAAWHNSTSSYKPGSMQWPNEKEGYPSAPCLCVHFRPAFLQLCDYLPRSDLEYHYLDESITYTSDLKDQKLHRDNNLPRDPKTRNNASPMPDSRVTHPDACPPLESSDDDDATTSTTETSAALKKLQDTAEQNAA